MVKLRKTAYLTVFLFISLAGTGCVEKQHDQVKLVKEVMVVEQRFSDYAKERGVKEAFLEFAADSAVLNRGGKIIKGKEAIKSYFESLPYSDVRLQWEPDFADVSRDGQMAYTYGSYTFSATDSLKNPIEAKGIFHTVWKRQPDGSWKYVYD